MSNDKLGPLDPQALAALAKKTMIRAIVVAVVIAAGVFSVHALEASFGLHFSKVPKRLSQPLPFLSKELGIPARYIAEGYDVNLDEAIVEVLGTRDYLQRCYRDLDKAEGDPGKVLFLNLNYYAIGSSTPHVPEVCWAGAGMTEARASRVIFDIPYVRRKDGSMVTLHARMISFLPRN